MSFKIDTGDVGDLVNRFDTDADPQTVFFLMPIGLNEENTDYPPLLKTLSLWAVKIEQTVHEKLPTPPDEHATVQASWDRASYRSRLLEGVLKSTPWMALEGAGESNQSDQTLTGVYKHDKATIRDIVTHALQSEVSILPEMRLKVIINYIAEVVILAADKVEKIQRFAVLLPKATEESRLTRDSMKLIMIGLQRMESGKAGETILQTTNTSHEAILNRDLLERTEINPKTLEVGKALVDRMSVDIVA